MISKNNYSAKVMEFTMFKKKDHVTDDEILQAVLAFETKFLNNQEGIIFHCLVKNDKNEYANVLFADDMETIHKMMKNVHQSQEANTFFELIKEESVQMNFNHILKEDFIVPQHFSCVEYGRFELNSGENKMNLLKASQTIEDHYLNKNKNTQGHFIGCLSDEVYTEVTFGETLGKTKEVCLGYTENEYCKALLNMANPESMHLDFWYLIA